MSRGQKLDKRFVGLLFGIGVLVGVAAYVRYRRQQANVDETRGFRIERRRYGNGTLTTKTYLSGVNKGVKEVTYKEKDGTGYSYEEHPGPTRIRMNVKLLEEGQKHD